MPTELEKQFAKLQKRLANAKTDKAATKARIQHAAFQSAVPLRDVIRTAMPVRTGISRKQLKIKNKANRRGIGIAITVSASAAAKKRGQDGFYYRFTDLGTKQIKARNVIRDKSRSPIGTKVQRDFAARLARILNGAIS